MTGPKAAFHAGVSPLDEAHGKRAAGDADGALRLGLAVLAASPHQLGAASLVSALLIDQSRPVVAAEVARRLVSAFGRRGDLAAATVAAAMAEDPEALLLSLAGVFGKGSSRLGDVSAAPPPLPAEVAVSKTLAAASGSALLDRAEDALELYLSSDDPVAEDAEVPRLPLFSELEPRPLAHLLGAMSLRELSATDVVVAEGEEGHEAFIVVRGLLEVVRGEGDDRATLAALGPGALFGEMALVSEAPRAASVLAVEPTSVLVVERADLEELAAKVPVIGRELGAFCRGRMVANLIRHSQILAAVDPAEREELVARFETHHFDAGDALVTEGADSPGLFLIASGGVTVSSKDEDGDRLRLAELGPGDVVGEISLVLRRSATADVVAHHPTVALELTRERFQEAIKDHPGLLQELYATAVRREEETKSVVGQEALDVEDVVLL